MAWVGGSSTWTTNKLLMRILDRYLLRELAWPLAACLLGIMIFWVSFDLFSELASFHDYKMGVSDIARYYVAKMPELLVTVMPVALLLALLYAVTNHARHHEIVAIRAAGISVWRLSAPYLIVGFLFSVLMLVLNEKYLPKTTVKAEEIKRRNSATETGQNKILRELHFKNDADGRTWRIESYNPKTTEMVNLDITWILASGVCRQFIAQSGVWKEDVWVLSNVQEFLYPPQSQGVVLPEPKRWESLVLTNFTESPGQILNEVRINSLTDFKASRRSNLAAAEIISYQKWHPGVQTGKQLMLQTILHSHFSGPLTCFIVVLVALPFGLPSGRRNVFVGVASSLVICFVFFVMREVFMALGSGGYLFPWLAAWMPNIVFGLSGVWAIQKLR